MDKVFLESESHCYLLHSLWLTGGLWALLLGSCSKDNPNPDPTCSITALQLPASDAETPILAGNTVTIQGQGFTANDQIWLRPNPTEKAAGDIQATDVQVVDQGISFTAPALDGPHTVLLVRHSDEYALGSLYFSTSSSESTPVRLIAMGLREPDYQPTFHENDPTSGHPSTPIFILENIFEACSYDVQNDRLYYLTYPHQSTDDQVYEKETMSIFDLSVGKTTILKNPISETLSTLLVMQP